MSSKCDKSGEPEDPGVSTPRRSSRIKATHKDSPLPTTTTVVAKRITRRSQSTQSLNDIQDTPDSQLTPTTTSVETTDNSKAIPLSRRKRSLSEQEIVIPNTEKAPISTRSRKSSSKEPDVEDQQGGRPKGRVTRSMSKSPTSVSVSSLPVIVRKRRLSLNEKSQTYSKVTTLDIITETEKETETSNLNENNNNSKTGVENAAASKKLEVKLENMPEEILKKHTGKQLEEIKETATVDILTSIENLDTRRKSSLQLQILKPTEEISNNEDSNTILKSLSSQDSKPVQDVEEKEFKDSQDSKPIEEVSTIKKSPKKTLDAQEKPENIQIEEMSALEQNKEETQDVQVSNTNEKASIIEEMAEETSEDHLISTSVEEPSATINEDVKNSKEVETPIVDKSEEKLEDQIESVAVEQNAEETQDIQVSKTVEEGQIIEEKADEIPKDLSNSTLVEEPVIINENVQDSEAVETSTVDESEKKHEDLQDCKTLEEIEEKREDPEDCKTLEEIEEKREDPQDCKTLEEIEDKLEDPQDCKTLEEIEDKREDLQGSAPENPEINESLKDDDTEFLIDENSSNISLVTSVIVTQNCKKIRSNSNSTNDEEEEEFTLNLSVVNETPLTPPNETNLNNSNFSSTSSQINLNALSRNSSSMESLDLDKNFEKSDDSKSVNKSSDLKTVTPKHSPIRTPNKKQMEQSSPDLSVNNKSKENTPVKTIEESPKLSKTKTPSKKQIEQTSPSLTANNKSPKENTPVKTIQDSPILSKTNTPDTIKMKESSPSLTANNKSSKNSTPVKTTKESPKCSPTKNADDSKESSKLTISEVTEDKTKIITEWLNTSKENETAEKITEVQKSPETAKPKSATKVSKILDKGYREKMLDEYIASFAATDKKRKRSLKQKSDSDSSLQEKKKKPKNKNDLSLASDDSEDSQSTIYSECDDYDVTTNKFIDDMAVESSEDTPSIDSNEIIDDGESIRSSSTISSDNDSYERGSFVVDDDDVGNKLLPGVEDFLGQSYVSKRKRIKIIDSDSDDELDKMSMAPFAGLSPSIVSDKQISSIDSSDMESIGLKNDMLSRKIEKDDRPVEDESDSDIIIIEDQGESFVENDSNKIEEENKDAECMLNDFVDVIDCFTEPQNLKRDTCELNLETSSTDIDQDKAVCADSDNIIETSRIGKKPSRRNTICEEVGENKTDDKSNKRVSLGLETMKILANKKQDGLKLESPIAKSTYEINKSGVFLVSPMQSDDKHVTSKQLSFQEILENEEIKKIIKDLNNSLNEEEQKLTSKQSKQQNNSFSEVIVEREDTNLSTKQKKKSMSPKIVTNEVLDPEDLPKKQKKHKKSLSTNFNEIDDLNQLSKQKKKSLSPETGEVLKPEDPGEVLDPEDLPKKQRKHKKSLSTDLNEIDRLNQASKQKKKSLSSEIKTGEVLEPEDPGEVLDPENLPKKQRKHTKSFSTEVNEITELNQPSKQLKQKKKSLSSEIKVDEVLESDDLPKKQTKQKKSLSAEINEKKKSRSSEIECDEVFESEKVNPSRKQKKQRKKSLPSGIIEEAVEPENLIQSTKQIKCKKELSCINDLVQEKAEIIKRETPKNDSVHSPENIKQFEKKKRKKSKQVTKDLTDETTLPEIYKSNLKEEKTEKKLFKPESAKKKNIKRKFQDNEESEIEHKTKNKLFKVKNEETIASKSEYISNENYVASKLLHNLKNLIKPSTSGFSRTNKFIVKSVKKESRGIKKQKSARNFKIKSNIHKVTNQANWKETLLTDDIVKTVKISKSTVIGKQNSKN